MKTLLFGCLLFLSSLITALPQQPRLEASVREDSVVFTLRADVSKHHRIDFSEDLESWRPLAILPNTNTVKLLSDSRTNAARFYRAVETAPGLQVFGTEDIAAAAGDVVRIEGQFFERRDILDNVVRFGDGLGTVLEASDVHLLVQVPEGARSGPVTVTTPSGTAASDRAFLPVAKARADISGVAGAYRAVNVFGFAETNGAARELFIRTDALTLNYALDAQTNRILMAITLCASERVPLSPESTAEALLFLSPPLATWDLLAAESTFTVIRTNEAVARFKQKFAALFPLAADPFENLELITNYQAAVASVANASGTPRPSGLSSPSFRPLSSETRGVGDYPMDLEFVAIDVLDEDGKDVGPLSRAARWGVGPRFPFINPVDWLYVVHEVNAAAAFPEGRLDFENLWRHGSALQMFPLIPGFEKDGDVEAELITEVWNPLKFAVGFLMDELKKALIPEDGDIHFPNEDGLYIVRALGPSFNPIAEVEFAKANYSSLRTKAVAKNLIAAAMDLISLMLDGEAIDAGSGELAAKVLLEAIKAAPDIKGADEAKDAVYDLSKFIIGELLDKAREVLVEAGKIGSSAAAQKIVSQRAALVAQKAAAQKMAARLSQLNAGLKLADILGGAGQIAQRILGFSATTALETSFIMVGDPFKIEPLTVAPVSAAPDDPIALTFGGPELRRMFDPERETDRVTLEGAGVIQLQVEEVAGTTNSQTLQVRIPSNLSSSSDGLYTLYVNTQGRRGKTQFRLSSVPFITEVSPRAGFAASDDFMGQPFPGTQLRVRGGVFDSRSQFFFGAFAEATNKTGGSGNVSVYIPKGARDSLLVVEGKNALGETVRGDGPVIDVWEAPIIDEVIPTHGQIGDPVALRVRDTGRDPSLIRVQFPGKEPQTVALSGGGVLTTIVPVGAASGPLRVITPGGSSSRPFTVDEGISPTNKLGGIMSVGGNSKVTFQRALVIAAGEGGPVDDEDFKKEGDRLINVDQEYADTEEGDYLTDNRDAPGGPRFPFGLTYEDRINFTGTFPDDANFRARGDRASGGTFTGKITVSGDAWILQQMTFKGEVTIAGSSNILCGTFEGPVRITGRGNVIRGTFLNQLTVEGDGNRIDRPNFMLSPAHGMVLRGHWNVIEGLFDTNAADGIRIDGGTFNKVTVSRARGNGGNGITLTGGAANNEINYQSGIPATGGVSLNSGNRGHGIALIGDARDNLIYVNSQGASGNGLDGALLDGPGVVLNHLQPFLARQNGRNGITITNGAANNFIGVVNIEGGSTSIVLENNGANGLAIFGGKFTSAAVNCALNGENGVLVSGVKDPPSGTVIVLQTGSNLSGGNGKAGLRLEKGATGVRAVVTRAQRDQTGLELDGADVEANVFDLRIQDAIADGVVIRGARHNDLKVRVERSGANGIASFGGSQNIFSISDCRDNKEDGVRLAGGSGNKVLSGLGAPFAAEIRGNKNGIVLTGGTKNNFVDGVRVVNQVEDGIVLEGAGTTGNKFLKADVIQSQRDGLVFRNGAAGNEFGAGIDNLFFPIRIVSLQDNAVAGVRMQGEGTANNQVAGAFISAQLRGQSAGIVIENFARDARISHVTFWKNGDGLIVRDGAHDVTITKSIFGLNTNNGVLVSNGSRVILGMADPNSGNQIYTNGVGIKLTGGAARGCQIQNNRIFGNTDGILLASGARENWVMNNSEIFSNVNGIAGDAAESNNIRENSLYDNINAGIFLANGSKKNYILHNLVTRNSVGILVKGQQSTQNTILNNSITENSFKGIELAEGGNQGLPRPNLDELQASAVLGTASAPDGSRVQLFEDDDDEGRRLIGSTHLVRGHFRAPFDVERWKVGILLNLTATVTDPDGNTSEFAAGFAEDGEKERKIAWSSTRDGNAEIYLIDREAPGGGQPMRLTDHPSADTSPALAAGCDMLVFASDRSGNFEVYSMEARMGAGARQLTTHPAADVEPRWLRPCETVVFVSDRDGNQEIYKMKADGADQTRLTSHPAVDRSPFPSPDGSLIVFETHRSGTPDIWIMNADGSGQRPLIEGPAAETEPAWSPDGEWIAFISTRNGAPELHVARADGSGVARVARAPVAHFSPVFTGDGGSLVFASGTPGSREIYIVQRQGGIPQPLTVSVGDNSAPSIP